MGTFPKGVLSGVILLVCSSVVLSQMQTMPAASFTNEDGTSTYAVYNGKVFKIPKKEEPSGWFNFDLLDNALVRTVLGWSDYFTGVSGQPDMYEEASLAASQSQSAAQYAIPNYNGINYNDNKNKYPPPPPMPPMRGQGQGFPGQYYSRPPPPQWQGKPLQNYGNPGFKSQFTPPRPAPVFQPMPPQPQIPMQPAPGFFPQEAQVNLNQPQAPYSVQVSNNFEGGNPKYNIPTVEVVTHVLGEGELEQLGNNGNPGFEFERAFDSSVNGEMFGGGTAVAERSDSKSSSGEVPQVPAASVRRVNPCPKIGQWNYEGELCVAVGNFPKWACKPSDLVGNRDIVVCRKKVWFPDELGHNGGTSK